MNSSQKKRPIKVLFLLRPASGGIRQHVSDLIKHLDREQVEPILVCPPEEPSLLPLETGEIPVFRINITKEFNPIRDFQASRRLKHLIQITGADLVHAHSFKAGLICCWANWGRAYRYPVICTFHNPLIQQTSLIKNFLFQSLVSAICQQAGQVVVVSHALQSQAVDLLKVPADKVACIYNGLNSSRIETPLFPSAFRREMKIGATDLLVGSITRLIPEKGIQYLIPAAARLREYFPNLRFVIVGDGPYRPVLEAEICRRGLNGQFILTGFRTDIPEILASLDLFVLPSLTEALSIAIMEAMAAKKPVIATKVGGIPEVVTPETGILVPPQNSEQLATAIQGLLSDPLKRAQLGEAGWRRIRHHFSIETMINEYHSLYRQVIDAQAGLPEKGRTKPANAF